MSRMIHVKLSSIPPSALHTTLWGTLYSRGPPSWDFLVTSLPVPALSQRCPSAMQFPAPLLPCTHSWTPTSVHSPSPSLLLYQGRLWPFSILLGIVGHRLPPPKLPPVNVP